MLDAGILRAMDAADVRDAAEALAETVADRETLALGVWAAVHGAGGMSPLDTPRDCADVIAAVKELRADRDGWRDLATRAREASDDARAEAERLRAIIAGRTTPPTREECDKHDANGATWLIQVYNRIEYAAIVGGRISFPALDRQSWPLGEYVAAFHAARWWPVDVDRRFCAWPVVGGDR